MSKNTLNIIIGWGDLMRKNFIIGIILILILLAGVWVGKHYITTKEVSNNMQLREFIFDKEKTKEVSLLAVDSNDRMLAALYSNGEMNKVIILQQDKIFKNRYSYYGGGSHSYEFGFNMTQDAALGALIIIDGNNTDLRAAAYEFTNNDKVYRKENLERYVLDIYIFEGEKATGVNGSLYDKNNNVIDIF